MLPPGIFLWKSGYENIVSPASVESLSACSQSWEKDMESRKPWGESLTFDSFGEFVKGSAQLDTTVVLVGECSSTMEVARILAQNNILDEWGAVVSVAQSHGRGQLRRPWVSPPGNLHVSVVLPAFPSSGKWGESLSGLIPLVAGYIISEGLAAVGANVQIKWPNDLLQHNRKVGGMLIEERNELVILGLGLNLAESPSDEQMREDRSVPASVLQTTGHTLGALTLWETLVNCGKSVYVVLLDELEPSEFLTSITRRLAWMNQMILVREGGGNSYHAEIAGISPQGGLVIRRDGEESVLFSGSITPL